jgi:hypothetical protein
MGPAQQHGSACQLIYVISSHFFGGCSSQLLQPWLPHLHALFPVLFLRSGYMCLAVTACTLPAWFQRRDQALGGILSGTGVKKLKLHDQGVLHWPILLLYPEVMSCDLIEDFLDTGTAFMPHIDAISFPSCMMCSFFD